MRVPVRLGKDLSLSRLLLLAQTKSPDGGAAPRVPELAAYLIFQDLRKVLAGLLSVHPHHRRVVYRFKFNTQVPVLPFPRHLESPVVPRRAKIIGRIFLNLPGVRNLHGQPIGTCRRFVPEFRLASSVRIQLELPDTRQRYTGTASMGFSNLRKRCQGGDRKGGHRRQWAATGDKLSPGVHNEPSSCACTMRINTQ